jgi:hypothetical protein
MRACLARWVLAVSAGVGLAASALLSSTALAQDSSLKAPDVSATPACWEIIPGVEKVVPNGAILLNRCNGATWILARTATSPATGKSLEEYTYRWYPISLETKEATLTNILPAPK